MIIKTIIITRLIIVIIKNVGVEQDHGGSRWSAVMDPDPAAPEVKIPAESNRKREMRKHKTTEERRNRVSSRY